MNRSPRSARPLRSGPVALVASAALLLSATGGAVAAAVITGADIKNGSVTTADIKNRTLAVKDLSPRAVAGLRGATGPAGPAGVPGAAGSPGLVRAYAHVSGTTTVDRQSGGITVTTPEVGYRCLTVPGVDPATTSPVATIDWIAGSTFGTTQTFVEVNTSNCPAGTLGVRTFTRDFSGTGDLVASNEPFFILIP